MYTDEELNQAVDKGIFSAESVEKFREDVAANKHSPLVDEENFRLISGFNDIFVVIAITLLLASSLWVLNKVSVSFSLFVFSALSWLLAEFFVRRRKMALPAIVLLITFVGGVFALVFSFYDGFDVFSEELRTALLMASGMAAVAAYLHWRRFAVPITVAAFTLAVVGFVITLFAINLSNSSEWVLLVAFICGLLTFTFAMYWDAQDTRRVTRHSDVAFWLHLLSAPLIVHPLFYWLGILQGEEKIDGLLIVLAFYFLVTIISLVIDRRVFMVSSLIYVLYALSDVLETYGFVGQGIAITGMLVGTALLFLSAFWQGAREKLLLVMPPAIKKFVPVVGA
jgi:hypothetical protein